MRSAASAPGGRPTSPDIEVRLLGTFEVRRSGRVVEISQRRVRTLLAALALHAGEAVATRRLIECLWEETPRNPRATLQNTVLRLRRLLGHDLVTTVGEAYSLRIEPDAVDALRLRDCVERGEWEQALASWRGEPLIDVGSDALEAAYSPALVDAYLAAVVGRAEESRGVGKKTELVTWLRSVALAYPLREQVWLQLMRALHESGQDAEALRTYECLRGALQEHLGADPDPSVAALHLSILRRSTSGTFSEPSTASRVPHQLPPPPPSLHGRASELGLLDGLSAARGHCAVRGAHLHGLGGVGKTALALAWSHAHAGRFPDGQIFVDLQGFGPGAARRPEAALALVLRSLGVPTSAIPTDQEERSALLRTHTYEKRMLLVLDNARDEDQVRPLLTATRGFTLVTSRNELRGLVARDDIHGIAVGPLEDHDAERLLRHGCGPRVPDALIRRCVQAACGLPLALRLLGEPLGRQSGQLWAGRAADVEGPEHVLRALSRSTDRRSNLSHVLSWSYSSLRPRTRRALLNLGAAPRGGLLRPAAAAACAMSNTETSVVLDELVACHLLDGHQERVRMHDLVRAHVRQLAATELAADTATDRLLTWYVHTLACARRHLRIPSAVDLDRPPPRVTPISFTDRDEAAAWCESECTNLVELVNEAASTGRHRQAWLLAHHSFDLVARHLGRTDEAGQMVRSALRSSRLLGDPEAGYYLAHEAAYLATQSRQVSQADVLFTEALTCARALGDPAKILTALSSTAVNAGRSGQLGRAVRLHQCALRIARSEHDDQRLGACMMNLSHTLLEHDRPSSAHRWALLARDRFRTLGLDVMVGKALINMAWALTAQGRSDLALPVGEDALALLTRHGGGEESVGEAHVVLDRIHTRAGRPGTAAEHRRAAVELLGAGHAAVQD